MSLDNSPESKEVPKENTACHEENNQSLRNIDLNANLNESEEKNTSMEAPASLPPATLPPSSLPELATEINHEEIPGWSLSDADKMAIDTMQLANLGSRIDDDEDYDEEG